MTKAIITQGRTIIEFPESKLLVAHPFYGPADSKTLREQIRKDGLIEPTSSQLAVFAHSLYGGERQIEQEVTDRMKNSYFRGFTGILFDPKEKLAYFIDYPEFDEKGIVDRDNLIKRTGESRAQVPFEHLVEGAVDWRKVAKHLYFVAWAGGEEGAEKLGELASRHPRKEAYVWVPNVSQLKQPEARTAALGSGDGLDVGAGDLGVLRYCYAFGVRSENSRSESREKK